MIHNGSIHSIDFQVPVKIVSEMNKGRGSEHWAVKQRRKKEQQEATAVYMHNNLRGRTIQLPCLVTLTRVGPKRLDSDGLAASFKFVRDAVAKKLGVDDGDEAKIKFQYEQMPIGIREYAVKISIQSV